jgi:hypothetical protein
VKYSAAGFQYLYVSSTLTDVGIYGESSRHKTTNAIVMMAFVVLKTVSNADY